MGGKTQRARVAVIGVGIPSHALELVAFLRRLDYDAELVEDGKVEASPPEAWPDRLGRTALEHFLGAWNRAHPEGLVMIEGPPQPDRRSSTA